MAQISGVAEFMVKWDLSFLKIFQCDLKHTAEIFIYDLTLPYVYDIIKTAPFMHAKC